MSSIQSTDSAGPIAIAPIIFNNFALTLSISEHKVMILYNALLLTLAYLTALFGSNFIFQQLHSLCRLRQPGEGDIQYGARKPMTSLQQPPSHWNYSRRLAGMYILITMLVSVPVCKASQMGFEAFLLRSLQVRACVMGSPLILLMVWEEFQVWYGEFVAWVVMWLSVDEVPTTPVVSGGFGVEEE